MLSIFPFLASSIMLTSFFFMVILSSVSPVMAPFDASLEMLKILFNAWGTYRTLFNFNVYHPCSFIFTVHFSSHFIFWPLPMSHQYHIIQYFFIFFYLYPMCNDAPLSPNHYLRSYPFSFSYTYPQNVAPTNRLLTSSSFCFFFNQQLSAQWTFFSKLFHSLFNWGFLLFLFLFPLFLLIQKYNAPWPYLPHLFHMLLKNCSCMNFFSPAFIARNFSSRFCFSCFLFPPNSVFQNQRIYFLRSLYAIFYMLTLQETITGLYSSGKTSKTCAFNSSSYFSYFSLIFLNLKFK